MINNIRVERARLRLSQRELAEKAGVSRQTINAIEAGKYIPSGLVMMKIATLLQMTVNEVFILEDKDWE